MLWFEKLQSSVVDVADVDEVFAPLVLVLAFQWYYSMEMIVIVLDPCRLFEIDVSSGSCFCNKLYLVVL